MKSCIFNLSLLFIWLIPAQYTAGNINKLENMCVPKITYFDKTVYNAANQTWSIAQNKKGYLYFANSAGLLEYDGSQWMLYTLPENTSIMRSIAIDNDQKIYSGIRNEFGYWEEDLLTRRLKYTSLSKASKLKFSDEEIWKIIIQDNNIYFQSFRNIYKYDKHTKLVSIIPAPNRYQFMFNVGLRIFVQDKVSGLMEIKEDRLSGIPGGEIFTGDCIYGMAAYDKRSILVATIDRGLYLIENDKIAPSSFPCNSYLIKNQVFSMTPIDGGKFAFGTILNGLLITDHSGNVISSINKPKGMPNNTVLSLFEDKNKNLWMGLDRGISHIQMNSPIRTFPDPNGLLGSIYQAEELNGKLYFATNQGLFYCLLSDLNNPEKELPIHLMEKSQGQVWGLQVVGNRLFCAHNKGIYVVNNDKGNFIYTKSGVTHWLYINEKTLLFLSYNGLGTLSINNNKYSVKEHPVFPYDGASLAKDINNNIYLGSGSAGYYKIKFDKEFDKVLSTNNQLAPIGLLKENINGIFSYKNSVYAIDKKRGILKLDNQTGNFKPDDKLNSVFPSRENILRLQISDNEMWCYGINKFFFIKDYEKQHPALVNNNMQSLYNQMISTFEYIKKVSSTSYMVCTSNSFAVLNTSYPSTSHKTNKIFIRDIGIFNDSLRSMVLPQPIEYYQNHFIEFPHNHKTIFIRFTVPDYENEGNIRYSYKLEGNSESFSIPSANNLATFTNLSTGEYTLLVKATVEGSDKVYYSQKLQIKILPPWYLGWIGGVILSVILIGFGLGFYRYLQLRWEKKQRRLMYVHEKEMAKMETQILQEKVKSHSSELARVTKTMLYKSKLINMLDNEVIKLAENKNMHQADLKGLKNIIEKNKNPDEEWHIFEMSFNKTHDNYLVKLSSRFPGLTPSDLKLAAYIRMNISSKEIAELMNITTKSIEMARYRLRKKLNLPHDQNLTEFLIGF